MIISFELINTFIIFQIFMNKILKLYINKFILIYFNNLLIYSNLFKKYYKRKKIYIKYIFNQLKIEFYEYIINKKII